MEILDRQWNQEKTKNDYKKVVWFYNFWSSLTESKAAKMVLELADIRDNQKVLEVACGTGLVFEKIVNKNPNGQNIGIDLSPAMLGKAKQRLQKSNYTNYLLNQGDVLNLGLSDNSFDLLVNNFMVDLMPQKAFDKIASEFYRVLKPNGIAVISTFSLRGIALNRIWYWIATKMPGLLTGCRPISFKEHLIKAGFVIEREVQISQNTFPSEVIKAIKN